MSTDLEKPPRVHATPMHPKDLEAIVTLLEIAAIFLTPAPGALFTLDELVAEAHKIAGAECEIDPKDARIVLPFMKTIRKKGRSYYLA